MTVCVLVVHDHQKQQELVEAVEHGCEGDHDHKQQY
jgi:hypothetical protein